MSGKIDQLTIFSHGLCKIMERQCQYLVDNRKKSYSTAPLPLLSMGEGVTLSPTVTPLPTLMMLAETIASSLTKAQVGLPTGRPSRDPAKELGLWT